MLKVGDRIPDFSINAEFGPGFSSDDIRGKRVVLYFYPKDDTPGCTKEACSFRDHLPRFKDLGVPVYGVSADDEKSHIRFARKFELNFPLVADPEHQLLSIFGTWVEKTMYGKKYFGVARSTFVIDAKGQVEKVWEQVTPDIHSAEVLAYLQAGTKQKPSPTVEAQKPKPSKPVIAKAKPGKSVSEPKPNKSKAKAASGKPKAKSKPSKPASKGPQVKKAVKSVAKPKKQIAKKKVSKPARKPVLKKAVSVSKSKPKVSKKAAPVKKVVKKASVSKKTKKTKR